MGVAMEGELVSPLLMAPVHIDPSCLHPDLLTEVQHVVIAREKLLLHLNQIIGRGEHCRRRTTQSNTTRCNTQGFVLNCFLAVLFCLFILYSTLFLSNCCKSLASIY